jgi:hypothetical protein
MAKIRKNERVRSVELQMVRNGYEVLFRGFPTLLGVKKGPDGQQEINFVYVRRKHKKLRGEWTGITRNQRYMVKILREGLSGSLKVSIL